MAKSDPEDSSSAVAEIDEDKVVSDLHTAPKEGGMYRTAEGSYIDAHGNVLSDKEVKRAERVQKIATEKREKEAKAVPVNTGMAGTPLTQSEFDAKVAVAVAAALAHQGAGSSPAATSRSVSR